MNKNSSDYGNLSPLLTDAISQFLNVKEIQSLGAANRRLHKNINNSPFIQKRIVDSKLTLEKIYDIVHEIALSEYKESFWRNQDGRHGVQLEIWNNSLGRVLKQLGICDDQTGSFHDKTPMITMLEQWMLLEVLSMDKNLFSGDKPDDQVIKDYLTQSEIQSRRKEFLEKNYVVDEQDTQRNRVFRNFNQIYFDQLFRTKKLDKKTKSDVVSKFIKFWLYQGSKNTDLVNDRKNDEYHVATFSEACKQLKRSFFDSKRTFSIDFKEFISQLRPEELNEYLFENKYYFIDHFKNEIVNNIDFICEHVLSKNKNLPDFNEKNMIDEFKKLLSNLGVNSKLIDEQMIDLSEAETRPSEKTDVIASSDYGNNVEIGLIQKIVLAIKNFFKSIKQKAATPVTGEKNENNGTHEFFSKPTGDTPAMFDGQKNKGLVK